MKIYEDPDVIAFVEWLHKEEGLPRPTPQEVRRFCRNPGAYRGGCQKARRVVQEHINRG